MVFMAVLFPTVLVATLLHPASPVSRVLECAPLRFIGKSRTASICGSSSFIGSQPNRLGPFQRFPLNLISLIAVAWLSYQFFEDRCLLRITISEKTSLRSANFCTCVYHFRSHTLIRAQRGSRSGRQSYESPNQLRP